jgi:hypothetical protein
MIYEDKDLILKLGKKGLVYHKNQLLFMGDIKKAMQLFVSHSNNHKVNKILIDRLSKTASTNPSD